MSTEKNPDFWLGVWQSPQISGAVQDQRAFDEDASSAVLKKQLANLNRVDYFGTAASTACAKQLQNFDTRLSFPLCVFVDFPTPPEPVQDAQGFFDWVHSTVTFMSHIPAQQLREGLKFSESDAVFALIQATVMNRSKEMRLGLWKSAYHRIVASLLMDNQESRSLGTIIKWIYLEGLACTSGEPDLYRLATIGHGYVETAARRLWAPSVSHSDSNTPEEVQVRSAVISFFLMVDLMRSLYTGSAPTLASSFKDIPLASRDVSIAYIRTKLITQLLPMPPTSSTDENFLILLVILNEIIVYTTLCPRKHIRIGEPHAEGSVSSRSGSSEDSFTPLSHGNEILRARRSLNRVLGAWFAAYQMSNGPERLLLYYFCKLYVTFPETHLLPVAAGFKNGVHTPDPDASTVQFLDMDDHLVAEVSHYAWLILENITACKGFLPVWCPIATFLAALVIWMCTQVQGRFQKARGSLMVLRLFKAELDRMTWLCAADMAEFLEQLAAT